MNEKPKLLFVDDERQILIALRALFRSQYQVLIANGGPQALQIIQKERIDVIISDQRMPEMLGHELLRHVKSLSPGTMRLLLTGYSDLGEITHSINDGEVFRFIHKPWDNAELRAIIESAVKIAHSTHASATRTTAYIDTAPDKTKTETAHADGPAIMIIEDGNATYHQISTLFNPPYTLYSATSVNQALDILATVEIGLIVTDVRVNSEDATDFIKLLKQQYPLVLTIVLTDALDSSLAIELINQGQIFRYLRKPIGTGTLRLSIQSGLRFYHTHKNNPELLARQCIERPTVRGDATLIKRLNTRLQTLRQRFSFSF